ncbi:hypothetical protein [Streptomyces parvulus]|uniref:hypothetical protein n=1 Tax=Streptomyces parvulus TaxID=146923 RepID=UPI00368E49A0
MLADRNTVSLTEDGPGGTVDSRAAGAGRAAHGHRVGDVRAGAGDRGRRRLRDGPAAGRPAVELAAGFSLDVRNGGPQRQWPRFTSLGVE